VAKDPLKPSLKKFSPESGLAFALRLGTEFTSGILVGLLMGYAIDHVFETQPWGLVVMVVLGATAGILNIFRLVGLWRPLPTQKPPSSRSEKKDG
jgi:ATP synthase protein I